MPPINPSQQYSNAARTSLLFPAVSKDPIPASQNVVGMAQRTASQPSQAGVAASVKYSLSANSCLTPVTSNGSVPGSQNSFGMAQKSTIAAPTQRPLAQASRSAVTAPIQQSSAQASKFTLATPAQQPLAQASRPAVITKIQQPSVPASNSAVAGAIQQPMAQASRPAVTAPIQQSAAPASKSAVAGAIQQPPAQASKPVVTVPIQQPPSTQSLRETPLPAIFIAGDAGMAPELKAPVMKKRQSLLLPVTSPVSNGGSNVDAPDQSQFASRRNPLERPPWMPKNSTSAPTAPPSAPAAISSTPQPAPVINISPAGNIPAYPPPNVIDLTVEYKPESELKVAPQLENGDATNPGEPLREDVIGSSATPDDSATMDVTYPEALGRLGVTAESVEGRLLDALWEFRYAADLLR
ncbi:hypothetical protein RUND412_006750 [Rhizina undulata]